MEAVFGPKDIELIEQMAEGMAPQEVCDWFGMQYSDLLPEDKLAFDLAFKKGRANIRFFAMRQLKASTMGKNGMQASLAILSQFGEEWERSGELAGIKSFKITIDD